MNGAAPPLVKPEFTLVDDLLREIESGRLRIPQFHRPFVWKPESIAYLFDSIRCGYPIGSLLFWDTDRPIASVERIGPIPIRKRSSGVSALVLDGQQRLSALYGVLRLPYDHPRGPEQSKWRWWLYYDLECRQFCHAPPGRSIPQYWMPMRALLRTVDFLKEAQRMQRALGEEAAAPLIEEAQSLAQQIRGYKITVMRIEGGELEHALAIFSRLNTTGQKITTDQMLSALTYKESGESFNLARSLDAISEKLARIDMVDVPRAVLLRAFMAAAGSPDVYEGEWLEYEGKTSAELSRVASITKRALFDAAMFLRDHVGVPSGKLLPYSGQFVPLSEFFRLNRSPTPEQKDLLRRWFWATSFSGWFASINSTSMREIVEEFRRLARGEVSDLRVAPLDARARPFPSRFDMRSARLRVSLLVMMQHLRPLDLDGKPVNSARLLREYGHRAFVRVFHKGPEAVLAHPADRVLLRRVNRRSVLRRLLDLSKQPEEHRLAVLRSHGISEEAFAALKADNPAAFVRARAHSLAEEERAFMKTLGIVPPDQEFAAPGEADIDTDDVGEGD